MAVKLNGRSFDYARGLIKAGNYVVDERDDWSEHQPSADQENRYLEEHGFDEYSLWYLGVDDEQDRDTKGRYKFPYGDFRQLHRCGLLAAETRAAQRGYGDIETAAHKLHQMLDELE
jgi:hypothetical protein